MPGPDTPDQHSTPDPAAGPPAPPGQAPPSYPQQPGYPAQPGYPPSGNPALQGYPPQQGYPPHQGYPPQTGYPQQGYPQQPGWGYVPTQPSAPKHRVWKTILAVAVPLVAVIIAGVVIVPRLPSGTPSTSPTSDIFAVPAVGLCYDARPGGLFNDGAELDDEVPCDEGHLLETIASGIVAGADPADWPRGDSAIAVETFAECVDAADRFLGRHWRMTHTTLILSIPGIAAWRSGAHWYRCDLGVADEIWGPAVTSTRGLRDAAVPITCVAWELDAGGESVESMEAVDCDEPHDGEFAGVFAMPVYTEAQWESEDMHAELDAGCWDAVVEFVGHTELVEALTFWYFYPFGPSDLDQSVVCIAAASGERELSASIEGIGAGPVPVL